MVPHWQKSWNISPPCRQGQKDLKISPPWAKNFERPPAAPAKKYENQPTAGKKFENQSAAGKKIENQPTAGKIVGITARRKQAKNLKISPPLAKNSENRSAAGAKLDFWTNKDNFFPFPGYFFKFKT